VSGWPSEVDAAPPRGQDWFGLESRTQSGQSTPRVTPAAIELAAGCHPGRGRVTLEVESDRES
jgi:hypothetical protein